MKNTKAKVTPDMLYTEELLTNNNSYKLAYKLHFRINMTTTNRRNTPGAEVYELT